MTAIYVAAIPINQNGGFHNGGTPKWMIYNGKILLKWMILGTPRNNQIVA
jgi:hypothetical protein